ncbi:hypothetical protein WB66_04945 [bacteria symbiont BFo1 of Frankliniella occidentalis]|uniref:Polymorphic toxin type 44 domain-containing protein n=1 Tax=Erwinia aphidicola TaxID=68334 RepID=A0ABU8DJZ2_ERWAP|nr:polymorphic toxin type 44 domain-containing protein [Erwinia aphidicola]KMV72044.1 hypothetical protein AI28_24615 [bacteria symbiont BFo1 of Frankliniella occidentalis]KYP85899.1 hypothetical protein WB66_04945 [bacteria symbiont BFo1 of Frankliniella occidentalis]KYP91475.1 hypothetical protein WB91_04645 [bacteria symbiont BFo1 of Frankliniella occidentalis]
MAVIPITPDGGTSVIWKNMREARIHGMPRDMATLRVYYWFYQKVRNHGPWDYKQQSYQLQNFGNFNFGATGTAAGIPADILLMGAGWAQSRAGTSQPNWGHWYSKPPYGDDPRDQFWIKQGIDYAKQHGF